ncbi:MAG: hypothetical protein ABI810_03080 [Sphingomonas bacterium]
MDFTARRQRLNIPVAPLAAALVGGVTALAFTLMPVGILEDFVLDSGVATIMRAAEPPLGVTARAVLILAGGGGIALITWFTLLLVLGARAIVIQRPGEDGEEPPLVLRRADAHPDAPARRPLSATRDLGTPFLEVRAERPIHVTAEMPEEAVQPPEAVQPEPAPASLLIERAIPADLDTPLAALDPEAIPASPVAWFPKRATDFNAPRPQFGPAQPATEPVAPPVAANADASREAPGSWFPKRASPINAPRQQLFDPGERFETFELAPLVNSPAPAPASVRAAEPNPEPEPVSPPTSIRPGVSARVEQDPSASIHALLDRLERVVGHRETVARPLRPAPIAPARPDSLQETLGTLRRLASRG